MSLAGIADLGLGIFGMAIGAVSLWGGRKLNRRLDTVGKWPTTTATVLSKEVVHYIRASSKPEWRTWDGRSWCEGVRYRFSVGGQDYEGSGYAALQSGSTRKSNIQAHLDALPDEVTVYYNPADPSEAYIHKGSMWWPLLAHFGGGLALFIGFGRFAGYFVR